MENIFYLECICGNINAIYSGQYHTKCEENRKCNIFDVNTGCAGGKYHYFERKMQSISLKKFHILLENSHY